MNEHVFSRPGVGGVLFLVGFFLMATAGPALFADRPYDVLAARWPGGARDAVIALVVWMVVRRWRRRTP